MQASRIVDAEFTEGAFQGKAPTGELAPVRRAPLPLYERDLTTDDLLELVDHRAPTVRPKMEQLQIKERHHSVARLLALGQSHVEVSSATGYSPARIRQLEKDPAFKELMACYTAQVRENFVDLNLKIALMSEEAIEIMRDRMQDPEQLKALSMKEIKEIAEMGLDRSGHSAVTKNVNVSASVSDLKSLRDEAMAKRRGTVRVGRT